MNYEYQNMENYSGLSNNGINGQIHTRQGYTHKFLRQVDGKSYVIVNPQNPNILENDIIENDIIENMGAFSISAAVRQPNCNCKQCPYKS